MKKTTFLFAVALLAATASFAQKGSILVGGDLNLQATKDPNSNGYTTSVFAFSISPLIGYQFSNAWTAGLVLGYTYFQAKQGGVLGNNSNNVYSVGPFVRYTRPLNSWLSIYGQLQATREDEGKISTDANGTPQDTYVGDIKLFPGLFFDVKNGFGINVSFGGLEGSIENVKHFGTIQESLALTFGNTILVGVSKNFGGHRKAS